MINPADGTLIIHAVLEKSIADQLQEKKDGLFKITFLIENGEIKEAVHLEWEDPKPQPQWSIS